MKNHFLIISLSFFTCFYISFGARRNGYMRAFRKGYYPGKESNTETYTSYEDSRPLAYSYSRYPSVQIPYYAPHPFRFYPYPMYPYYGYEQPGEDIYDYKMKIYPLRPEIITEEELEYDVDEEEEKESLMKPTRRNKATSKEKESRGSSIKTDKEKKVERKKWSVGSETVHIPDYNKGKQLKVFLKKTEKKMVAPALRSSSKKSKKKIVAMDDGEKTHSLGLLFRGEFPGGCSRNGLYYKDEFKFVICTNKQSILQPCAPGTKNKEIEEFGMGQTYTAADFCTINLVAMGNYHVNALPEGGQEKLMNQKVKNYFDRHYKS